MFVLAILFMIVCIGVMIRMFGRIAYWCYDLFSGFYILIATMVIIIIALGIWAFI